MKLKINKGENTIVAFDYKKGTTLILENSNYRKEGPILLDVSITNRCGRGCFFCYRKAKPSGTDISLSEYELILKEAKKCGVNQIAIGGGEPTLHPNFVKILKMTHDAGIIPNYSTNGDNISDEAIKATALYCGSVAFSIYDNIETYKERIIKFCKNGVSVNLHFILSKNSIDYCKHLLTFPPDWFDNLNGIIFLNYKPVVENENCLKNCNNQELKEFFDCVKSFNHCSIGFDSCASSFVAKYLEPRNEFYSYCESARYSAFINESLVVLPCSFYQARGEDLRKHTLYDIWNYSKLFSDHRKFKRKNCLKCLRYNQCKFGCPIYEIATCD